MRTARVLATVVLAAAAGASLLGFDAFSAAADPVVAPTTAANSDQSFMVPVDTYPADASISLVGHFDDAIRFEDARIYGVALTCDNGRSVAVVVDGYTTAADGYHSGYFHAEIPLGEQGRVCTIHGSAPAQRKLVFSAPSDVPGAHGEPQLVATGAAILATRSGGLA